MKATPPWNRHCRRQPWPAEPSNLAQADPTPPPPPPKKLPVDASAFIVVVVLGAGCLVGIVVIAVMALLSGKAGAP